METLLKKPEIFRDSMGRFDRHGKSMSKTANRTNGHLIKKNEEIKRESDGKFSKGHGGPRAGAGRPKGSKNRTTLQLKEAILNALNNVGGEQYLAKLAIENSSAFASLLGKILPHTLAPASESDGGGKLVFERVICRKGDVRSRAKHPSSCRLYLPVCFPTTIRRLLNRDIAMINQTVSVLIPSVMSSVGWFLIACWRNLCLWVSGR